MRRFFFAALALLIATALPLNAQTTIWSAETGNNTAACAAANSPSYCKTGFSGMSDSASGTYNPRPANVSDVDIHSLLTGGAFTKVFAYFQGWFCMPPGSNVTGSGTNCGSHVQVGYNSNDSTTINGQVNDMIRRGLDGVVFDYYGPTLTPYQMSWKYDDVAAKLSNNLQARCSGPQSCPLLMSLLEDEGSWIWTNCPYNGGGADQTTCLISKINSDLAYMNQHYFGSDAYLRVDTRTMQVSPQGSPVVLFFVCEECYTNPNPDWAKVWSSVRAYSNTLNSAGSSGLYFIFRDTPGFSHTQTNGSFAWINWDYRYGADPYGLNYLKVFYDTAASATSANPSLMAWGADWKGFDDTNAAWKPSPPRTIQQQCGQTWLNTIRKANDYYSMAKPLPFLGIPTWNDYDEGSEIETGIGNCLRISAKVSSFNLTWNISFSSSSGSESTVARYDILDDYNGVLTRVASLSPGSRSLDLRTLSLRRGWHHLYVKAVGQPSIQNQISAMVKFFRS